MSPAENAHPLNGRPHAAGDLDLPALPPELRELEHALRGLAPREDRLDRDRLLFAAGRESATVGSVPRRKAAWFWPAATAAMTTVATSLALLLVMREEVQVIERIKIVEVERDPQPEVETPAVIHEPPQMTSPGTAQDAQEIVWSWTSPARPIGRGDLVPRAGLDFRLFEHLIGESMTVNAAADREPPAANDESVISPRSLPRLLDRSA